VHEAAKHCTIKTDSRFHVTFDIIMLVSFELCFEARVDVESLYEDVDARKCHREIGSLH
jgi:hypothetical protein